VVDRTTERRLLENVLDALDDLYDRRDHAESWVQRLLMATSIALRGTEWEQPMVEAATAIELIQLNRDTDEAKNAAALLVTGDLRLELDSRVIAAGVAVGWRADRRPLPAGSFQSGGTPVAGLGRQAIDAPTGASHR
jgi:hypothetical protein